LLHQRRKHAQPIDAEFSDKLPACRKDRSKRNPVSGDGGDAVTKVELMEGTSCALGIFTSFAPKPQRRSVHRDISSQLRSLSFAASSSSRGVTWLDQNWVAVSKLFLPFEFDFPQNTLIFSSIITRILISAGVSFIIELRRKNCSVDKYLFIFGGGSMSKEILVRDFARKITSDQNTVDLVRAAAEAYMNSLDPKDKIAIFKAAFSEDELSNLGFDDAAMMGCTGTVTTATTPDCTTTTLTTTLGC